MFIGLKEPVNMCNTVAHWCGFNSFWTMEACGSVEEAILDFSDTEDAI